MAFSTTDLPQADKLDKVIQAVEAVSNGEDSDLGISNYIGFTARQGRYYRHAAETLGFITNYNNKAAITELGQKLIAAETQERKNILQQAILNNGLFEAILEFVKRSLNGANKKDIENFVFQNTVNPSQSTIERRLTTLIQWLIDDKVELLEKRHNRYLYKPSIIIDDKDTRSDDLYHRDDSIEPSLYPMSSYDFELDIREEYITVLGFLKRIDQKKVLMNPDFQRNLVWKQFQKSQFIESLILNIPLPPIYVSQDLNGNYIIVDGLQRSATLRDFLKNKFPLEGLQAIPKLNGLVFSELEMALQARIEDKNLLLYILKSSVPMVVVYDIFNRINTGGTQLTRQEIRNCIFIGKSTDLLKVLSEHELFKKATDYGISPIRMKDREAVLRYLAFKIFDYNKDYNNDMDDFLGRTMRRINGMDASQLDNLKKDFLRSMKLTFDLFEYRNFRLPTEFSRGRINIAMIESISFFVSNQSDKFLISNQETIKKNYNELLGNTEYIESVRFSTGSTSKVKTRFEKASSILSTI
jgi:hypothetical protein